MPTTLVFPIPPGIILDGNRVTDANRSDIDITPEKIEYKKRMANGRMRRFLVAEKYSFDVSWKDLPESSQYTVDGFWGAKDIEDFYLNHNGSVELKITLGDKTVRTYQCMFDKFDMSLIRRSELYDFYDVGITLDEI